MTANDIQSHSFFFRYLDHATVFRKNCLTYHSENTTQIPIIACATTHPGSPTINFPRTDRNTDNLLYSAGPQPSQIIDSLQKILQDNYGGHFDGNDLLVIPGSSTQWLDSLIGISVSELVRSHVDSNRKLKPVILCPRGAFKCGAYFPWSRGARLKYIPTTIENRFKITTAQLVTALEECDANGETVCCFLIETPSAIGQCYSRSEIEQIVRIIGNSLVVVQDLYHALTEHTGCERFLIPEQFDNVRSASVLSFRRVLGNASNFARLSACITKDPGLFRQLELTCKYEQFGIRPTFSQLEASVVASVIDSVFSSSFVHDCQNYWALLASHFSFSMNAINVAFRQRHGGRDAFQIVETQAGQFGFVFLDQHLCELADIDCGEKFAELLAIEENTMLLTTLLDPMGISMYKVGVRINLAESMDLQRDKLRIEEIVMRLGDFADSVELGRIKYNVYSSVIDRLKGIDIEN